MNGIVVRPPKILSCLEEWWDRIAPGEWQTIRVGQDHKAIEVKDDKLFLLFKLAWMHRDEIYKPKETDAAAVYAPYIPLISSSFVTWAANDSV